MSYKAKKATIMFALSVAATLILWLTLFSRIDSDSRHFYPPFWSYKAIVDGNVKALVEVVGNIVLFLPIGVIAALILRFNLWKTVISALALSLVIESCQWVFWLGSFEIDDLLHNTLGAVIGLVVIDKTVIGQRAKWMADNRKKNIIILSALIVLIIATGLTYQRMRLQEMKCYAAMNDRVVDGSKNLLVLSPDSMYIGQTDFSVSYNIDGSVAIEGCAENRAWIQIAKFTLPAGNYTLSGFSGIPDKTVGIELEKFNGERYVRLTPDIGPIDEVSFELDNTTKLRALIGIYAGADGEFIARPAIYRED